MKHNRQLRTPFTKRSYNWLEPLLAYFGEHVQFIVVSLLNSLAGEVVVVPENHSDRMKEDSVVVEQESIILKGSCSIACNHFQTLLFRFGHCF